MANANSAKDSSEEDNIKPDRHTALTFTEVPSTQEVDTDHENDYNQDVDGYVFPLIATINCCSRGATRP